jgi:hypothetical protein
MHLALRNTLVAAVATIGIIAPLSSSATASASEGSDHGRSSCKPSSSHTDRAGRADAGLKATTTCDARVGDLVDTALVDLHPTQPSLGYDEVYYKLGRYTLGKDAINKKFDDWCEANGQEKALSALVGAKLSDPTSFACTVPLGSETVATTDVMKTAVVGPHGQLFLTDGHHTFTSFWETPDGGKNMHVRVRITGNLSKLRPAAFWTAMQANGWTWLRDNNDQQITPQQLPAQLGLKEFGNDPYRAALYFARDVSYRQGADIPAFQEYYWGRWMRQNTNPDLSLGLYNLSDQASYLTLVEKTSRAIVALNDTDLVSDGKTAGQLGKLPLFNSAEFTKLSLPYSDAKPGKIAYAMAYKATL